MRIRALFFGIRRISNHRTNACASLQRNGESSLPMTSYIASNQIGLTPTVLMSWQRESNWRTNSKKGGWFPNVDTFGFTGAAIVAIFYPETQHAKGLDDKEKILAQAQAHVTKLWEELELDIDRNQASSQGSPSFDQIAPPSLSWVDGGMRAVMILPQISDLRSVKSAIVSSFSAHSTSKEIENHMDINGISEFKLTASFPSSNPLCVTLQSSPHGPCLLIVTRKGSFLNEDLSGLEAVARCAYMDTLKHQSGRSPGSCGLYDEDQLLISPGGFFEGLQWFMEEAGREMQAARRMAEVGQANDGEEATGFFSSHFEAPFKKQSETVIRHGDRFAGSQSSVHDGYDWGSLETVAAVKKLQGMGAQVFPPGSKGEINWGALAGYSSQKRQIEDCLLFPLFHPDIYSKLTEGTRGSNQSNRPRGVLFEGPPGTGKTTSARVISSQASVPLIYVPLESVMSKWYGESENLLAQVFKSAETLGGAILFFDELDALSGNREHGDMHEVSRRMLSVMLREMDGFDARKSVVIGATNRKSDLDAALLSRFDMVVTFGLPDEEEREQILSRLARHLPRDQLKILSQATADLSGRDLRDIAENTERRWASKIIRGEVKDGSLPVITEYIECASMRKKTHRPRPMDQPQTSWSRAPYIS